MKSTGFATAEELKGMSPVELYDYFAQQSADEPIFWDRENNDNYFKDNHPYQLLRKLIYNRVEDDMLIQELLIRRVYKNHCAPTFRQPKEDTIKTYITVWQYADTIDNRGKPIVDIMCNGFVI